MIIEEKTKICTKCMKDRNIKLFDKDKYRKDGLTSQCKECRKEYRENNKINSKNYRENNKEKIKEYFKEYYKNNKEVMLEKNKDYRKNNIIKLKHYHKTYHKNNKQILKKIREKYENTSTKFESKYTKKLEKYGYEAKNNNGYLEIKCKFCKNWFTPLNKQLKRRLDAINGYVRKTSIENNLYCSEECKNNCPVYRLKSDPNKQNINNKNNPEWVKMILEQANYKCEICGSTENLNAHHEIPVAKNPLLAEDRINGWCLCDVCHYKIVHKLPGCDLVYLKKVSCLRR